MNRRRPVMIEGVEHWLCPTCGESKPSSGYYKRQRNWNGIGTQCKACHCRGAMRTRDAENTRRLRRQSARRVRLAEPVRIRAIERRKNRPPTQKTIARRLLNAAVRRGQVERPDVCSRCGHSGRVTGHHRDYSKPLAVDWLCYECHGIEHRKPGASSYKPVTP